jgi:hypothetical protein
MKESTSAMMTRDVPIDLRMPLKAIAAMQRRRLRDMAIEALQEKAKKHVKECTLESSYENAKGSHDLDRVGSLSCYREHPQGFIEVTNLRGPLGARL